MASTILFVSGKFLSFKNDGTVNSGGLVYLFEPGTSTPKVTYSDSSLTTANAHPVVLDSAGRATVYFAGNGDLTVRDSDSAVIYTQSDVNPQVTSIGDYFTTETTLDDTHSGKYITTIANIILPTVLSVGSGWYVSIKNLNSSAITISRNSAGDTLNNTASNLSLPPNHSLTVIVNDGETGYDIFFNSLLETGTPSSGQVMSVGDNGPEWQTIDLITSGNDLYLYNNFT